MFVSFASIVRFFLAEFILIFLVLSGVIVEYFANNKYKKMYEYVVGIGLLAALVNVISLYHFGTVSLFNEMVVIDRFAIFFKVYFIILAFIVQMLFINTNEIVKEIKLEFSVLTILLVVAMSMLVSTTNLIMIIIASEIVMLLGHMLSSFDRNRIESGRSSVNNLIFSMFFTTFMMLGVAIIFIITKSVTFEALNQYVANNPHDKLIGISLMLICFGLVSKVAVFPFHQLKVNIFEKAPISFSVYYTSGILVSVFVVLLRLIYSAIIDTKVLGHDAWTLFVCLLGLIGMTYSSIVMLYEKKIRNKISYISLANVSFCVLGAVDLKMFSISSVLFLFSILMFANIGVCKIISILHDKYNVDEINQLKGLGWKNPFEAILLTVFLITLSGIPLGAGFIGKYFIINSLIGDQVSFITIGLGLFNWLLVIYSCLSIVFILYQRESFVSFNISKLGSNLEKVILISVAFPIVILGLKWNWFWKIIEDSLVFILW